MPNLQYIIGSLFMLAVLSCKKDDAADIIGNSDTIFFTNNANYGNMPGNSITYSAVNIPDPASSAWLNLSSAIPAVIKIPVYATKPVKTEVTINAEPDNSLVAAYNTLHNTSYAELPAGILNTQSLSARIQEGQTTCTDSLSIAVTAANLKTLNAPAYLVPIKLTTLSDQSVGSVSTNTEINVVYVVVNIELRQIKYLAAATDVTGTLQTKTTWSASFTPAPATVGSILDNSTTTYSRWAASPVQVDLDMQSSKNMTGFRLYSSTTSSVIPTQIDAWASDDGINYKVIGSVLRANLTYSSGYNYVVFYKPIAMRYLRLKVYYSTSTSTQNYRIAELDVYVN